MRRYQPDLPYSEEEFLFFLLSSNDSVESVVNRTCFKMPDPLIFSSEKLARWTIDNWSWAVEGVVTCSQYINVMYSHSRILNHAFAYDSTFKIAHFRKELPIYDFYLDLPEHYQVL